MNVKNLSQSDSPLGFGSLSKLSDKANTLTESDTLSNLPTSKSNFAPRKYPHTPEQITRELRVDEEGKLWWKQKRLGKRRLDRPAGWLNVYGYLQISLDGSRYPAHAVAFSLYHRRWPAPGMVLDHINGDKADNREENIREVTNAENMQNRIGINSNNSTGVAGVYWDKRRHKWFARIQINWKFIFGGYYEKFEDAVEARRQLEITYGIADYAVVTSCTSPKSKTLDSMSTFQNISL